VSDDEIRIAIAEVCGLSTKLEQFGGVMAYRGKDGFFVAALPNYLNDLNAMHEAEKVLDLTNQCRYSKLLHEISSKPYEDLGAIFATARQRAEAFLHTVGKWKESVE
jgi:hypothetical protein